MANPIRIKRRLAGGASGAPSTLLNAELAFNEQDLTLYYGAGDSGGNATSIIAIAGSGAYTTLGSTQTITGNKTFSGTVAFGANTSGVTASTADNSTLLATTAFVKAQNYGTGTVTSVGLSLPGIFTVSGSPVTGSGTLTATLASQSANLIWASPNGSAGAPTFRALVANDIPTLTASKISDFDTEVQTNRLDQMAAPTTSVSFNNQRITNVATPTQATDAVNKAYADSIQTGIDPKESCRVATTATVGTYNSTAGASGRGQLTACPNTVDGVTLANGNRVLVKDHSNNQANGIYVVTTVGTGSNGVWDRATDFDSDIEVTANAFTFVSEGTANADSAWTMTTNDNVTIGGTSGSPIVWVQFSGGGQITAGAGMTKTGNTLDIGTASSSRIVINADNIDLATTAVSPGTYRSVTVDTYGRVTAGTNPTTLAGYGITDAQPLDATLTALAGVTTVADRLIYATGADTFTVTTFTAFARTLLDDVDAAAARTTLGLGTMATQNANNVNITGGVIDNITIDGGTF